MEAYLFRDTDFDILDVHGLFNASPNAYVLLDRELTIVGCNNAYLRTVGRASRDEIVGRYVFDAFPSNPESESYQLLRSSLDRVLTTESEDHLALIPYNTSPAGEAPLVRYWSATHTPIFDSSGAFRFILQHTVDVTELQKLRAPGNRDIKAAGVLARAASVQAANVALSTEVDLVRTLFRQAPGFVAVLTGPAHVFQLANAAYENLVGRTNLVGKGVAEALPEVVDQGFIDLLDQVLITGVPFVGEGVAVQLAIGGGAPTEHVLDFVYQPILDDEGKAVGVFVQGHDITKQRRFEQQLIGQTEMMRLAQAAGGFGTFEWDIATGMLTPSDEFRRLYGFADDDKAIPVTVFRDRVHPDDASKLATDPARGLEEALAPTEYRIRREDGTLVWVARQGSVLRDAAGRPVRVVGAVHDITQRKQAELQLQTMAMESTHRIKNLLSVVQAIAAQSIRRAESLPDAASKLSKRLQALGTAQSALVSGPTGNMQIREIVEQFMSLHADYGERVEGDGPDVIVDQRTAMGLALVLHELGTNAAKYGALSNEGGRVSLTWQLDAGEAFIDLRWQEDGGPAVFPPNRQGFGSTLMEKMLPIYPGTSSKIEYAASGVTFTARLSVVAP